MKSTTPSVPLTIGLAALAAMACAKTPVTHRTALNLVPESQMTAMGRDAYKDVLAESEISRRADWTELVQRVGKRIAVASGADLDWEFNLLDEPETVNAFALPGGKVAVYTGLLPVAQNEAALAAVLGHEVAHVTAHHGAERVSQTMIVQLGLTAAQLSLADSSQRDTLLGLLGIGAQVGVLLPFSRLHESEADEIGLTYMAKAGYDPDEAATLWDRMAKAGGGEPPELLSTHPASSERAAKLRELAGDAHALYETSDKQPTRLIP